MQPTPVATPLPIELMLAAYCRGIFPMAMARDDAEVHWFSPDPRAVMPLDDRFHVPRSLRRVWRQWVFEIRTDTAFEQVIDGCAAPRADDDQTWINPAIRDVFVRLHHAGYAHSIETWRGGRLMGGLYGLAIGGVFFGESMFRQITTDRSTHASKIALVATVEHLRARGFGLFDVQFPNPLLDRFGAIEIRRDAYLEHLHEALRLATTWTA